MTIYADATVSPLHRLLTSFGGVPCGQIWADFMLWELLLNAHPDVAAIIEIGTWQGGFSRYLNAQAELRGIAFVTYDAVTPGDPPPHFRRLDVFADPDVVEQAILSPSAPVVLLCDGGNKPREAALFAPTLPPGSIMVVHDWLTEFMPEDVPACVHPVYEDVCDELGSMSRVFAPNERSTP